MAWDYGSNNQLESRHAVQSEAVDGILGLVGRPRNIGGVGSIFDAVAIVGEWICAGAVDAFAVALAGC